jgi:hypothetical protein
MSEMFDDVRFWLQVLRDGERTVVCSLDLESRIKTRLAPFPRITVEVSPFVADGQILVIDQHSLDASLAQGLQADSHERRDR